MFPRLLLLILAATPLAAQSRDCDGHFTQLVVPSGFCVHVFADSVGPVRQVIVHPTGQVIAALNEAPGMVVLRDFDGDGHADQVVRFGPGMPGTGVAWRAGWLYFAADAGVVRYRWPASATAPDPKPEWIVRNLPTGGTTSAKGIAVGTDGMVYVSIAAATDNCQVLDRAARIYRAMALSRPDAAGRCLALLAAGRLRWRMAHGAVRHRAPERRGDRGRPEYRASLWVAATQGRDYLNREWGLPDSTSANQPAEMLVQVVENGDYGWPYCQGDWTRLNLPPLGRAPEYLNQGGPGLTAR